MNNRMKKIIAFLCVLTLSVSAMGTWNPVKEVKATDGSTTSGVTPVYLEGYKHVTLEDFGLSEGVTYSENKYAQLKDSNGTAVAGTFDKTLISLKVKFTQKDTSSYGSPLVIGGDAWRRGFALRTNKDGTAIGILDFNNEEYPMTTETIEGTKVFQTGVLYATDVDTALGTSDFNFYNEFILQVRFDYATEGEQTYLTLTFYVNGEQIKVNERLTATNSTEKLYSLKMKISSDKANHGTYIGFEEYGNGGTLTMSSVVVATEESTGPTPVYKEGFKHVTLTDFGLSEGTTYSENKYVQLKDSNGTAVAGTFDKTLLSLRVKFTQKDTSSYGSPLVIGGDTWNRGFALRTNKDGTAIGILDFKNENYPMTTEMINDANVFQTGVLYAADVDTALGTSGFNFYNEFTLQVSFEYTTEGEQTYLTLTFYVNGEQIKVNERLTATTSQTKLDFLKMKISSDKANHGTYIGFEEYGNGGTLTMASVVPEDVAGIAIPNKAFLKSGQKAYVLKERDAIMSLDNTSFEGKVTFLSNSDNDVIYYGGDGVGTGLRFSACGENGEQLKLLLGDAELYLDATTADVTSFVDNEIHLKITTEYANYDGDDDSNDVQLGIFVNGKLYNNRYLYAYDYTTAGNYVTIDSNEKGIMLRSATAGLKDVTYNLSQGVYGTITTDFPSVTKATFGEKKITNFSVGLNESGDYILFNDAEANVGEVVLYQAGDTHPDSETDVRDLVAMIKVNANVALDTWAGTMGAYEAGFSETQIIEELLNITEQ